MKIEKSDNENPTIKDLYPHLDDEQLGEAEENLELYVKLVLRIYERVKGTDEALRVDKFT